MTRRDRIFIFLEHFHKSCSAGAPPAGCRRRLAAKSPKAPGRGFNPQPGRGCATSKLETLYCQPRIAAPPQAKRRHALPDVKEQLQAAQGRQQHQRTHPIDHTVSPAPRSHDGGAALFPPGGEARPHPGQNLTRAPQAAQDKYCII